jgi:hypothetical protein
MTKGTSLGVLAGMAWLIAGCQTSSGVDAILDPGPAVATLTDRLTHGELQCLFTLRMTSEDTLITVNYEWDVDRTRSQLPSVDPVPVGETGSFRREWVRSWEWTRPDNGFALILNTPYRIEAGAFAAGGRLITYCP